MQEALDTSTKCYQPETHHLSYIYSLYFHIHTYFFKYIRTKWYTVIRKNFRRENLKQHLSLRMSGWHTSNHTQPGKQTGFQKRAAELWRIKCTRLESQNSSGWEDQRRCLVYYCSRWDKGIQSGCSGFSLPSLLGLQNISNKTSQSNMMTTVLWL